MKKFIILFSVLVLSVGFAYADPQGMDEEDTGPKPMCPETLMQGDVNDCMRCHVMTQNGFALQEFEPYAEMEEAIPVKTTIIMRDGEPIVRYYLTTISDWDVCKVFDWLAWHPQFKHLMLEIQSPGGSLFASQRIVGMMDAAKARGVTVETRCYGFAASAGFYILVNGSPGYRYAAPEAQLMWHELKTFKMWDVSSPADKEDEAEILRHLQETVNNRIASVSNVDVDELNKMVRKKELWVNGSQSLEKGFIDHLTE